MIKKGYQNNIPEKLKKSKFMNDDILKEEEQKLLSEGKIEPKKESSQSRSLRPVYTDGNKQGKTKEEL